jgi:hypothetical protein
MAEGQAHRREQEEPSAPPESGVGKGPGGEGRRREVLGES